MYIYYIYMNINIHIHIRASIYATNLFQTPNSEFMVFVNPRVLLDPALRSLPNGIEANLKPDGGCAKHDVLSIHPSIT